MEINPLLQLTMGRNYGAGCSGFDLLSFPSPDFLNLIIFFYRCPLVIRFAMLG